MREKELRLAWVCFGGISLAVYMHGASKEILKPSATRLARLCEAPPPCTSAPRVSTTSASSTRVASTA
ncbi:MAG: hypothetical protein EHM50_07255 [Lysobacterales bacterium]|nr:MAG: hypothetical protein EHM50_07255 [Xanthomonadales bacterium]